MAVARSKDEVGLNRAAVESVVADLEERGLLSVADGPLVEVARSLASAVDADPSSSQHVMQYRAAVQQLRDEVQRVEADVERRLNWQFQTGCDVDAHPFSAHCSACCEAGKGLDWASLEGWSPPARVMMAGRSNGSAAREVTDEDFARFAVREFLSGWPWRKGDR